MQEIRNPNLILRILFILSNIEPTIRLWYWRNLAIIALT